MEEVQGQLVTQRDQAARVLREQTETLKAQIELVQKEKGALGDQLIVAEQKNKQNVGEIESREAVIAQLKRELKAAKEVKDEDDLVLLSSSSAPLPPPVPSLTVRSTSHLGVPPPPRPSEPMLPPPVWPQIVSSATPLPTTAHALKKPSEPASPLVFDRREGSRKEERGGHTTGKGRGRGKDHTA